MQGTEAEVKAEFLKCMALIEERMEAILNLDLDNLKGDDLKAALLKLGAQG